MPGGRGGGLAVGGGGLGLLIVVGIVLFNMISGGGGGTGSTGGGLLQGANGNSTVDNAQLSSACKTGADANTNEDCAAVAVINSVQGYWADTLASSGTTYREADTVFFSGSTAHRLRSGQLRDGPVLLPAR